MSEALLAAPFYAKRHFFTMTELHRLKSGYEPAAHWLS